MVAGSGAEDVQAMRLWDQEGRKEVFLLWCSLGNEADVTGMAVPSLIVPQRPQHWKRATRILLSVELVFVTEPWFVPS